MVQTGLCDRDINIRGILLLLDILRFSMFVREFHVKRLAPVFMTCGAATVSHCSKAAHDFCSSLYFINTCE